MLNKILAFMSECAEGKLYDAEQEEDPKKCRELYQQHTGMRQLIDAVIDDFTF